jgi:hypothetical protein
MCHAAHPTNPPHTTQLPKTAATGGEHMQTKGVLRSECCNVILPSQRLLVTRCSTALHTRAPGSSKNTGQPSTPVAVCCCIGLLLSCILEKLKMESTTVQSEAAKEAIQHELAPHGSFIQCLLVPAAPCQASGPDTSIRDKLLSHSISNCSSNNCTTAQTACSDMHSCRVVTTRSPNRLLDMPCVVHCRLPALIQS